MIDISQIDFGKNAGLIPAIIQDARTLNVLMLGYMNADAITKSIDDNVVTFWSRSKERLWTKGETSGNTMRLVSMELDCDQDTLLVKVNPQGPTCHKGSDTCWGGSNVATGAGLDHLEHVVQSRKDHPSDASYTSSLFAKGINKVAQKVGEEAVELVIEAKDDNKDLFLNEAADLMYHFIVLLVAKGFSLSDVMDVLKEREP